MGGFISLKGWSQQESGRGLSWKGMEGGKEGFNALPSLARWRRVKYLSGLGKLLSTR